MNEWLDWDGGGWRWRRSRSRRSGRSRRERCPVFGNVTAGLPYITTSASPTKPARQRSTSKRSQETGLSRVEHWAQRMTRRWRRRAEAVKLELQAKRH